MIAAATTQPTAIHTPPNTIQSRLRSTLVTDITPSPSPAEIAEVAVQVEITRNDLALHLREPRLEVGEFALQGLQRVGGRGADAAPERLLIGARVQCRRLWPERQCQDDIGDDRRREKEEEAEHGDEPHDDRLDADVVGDPGAYPSDDAAISVAPQAMTRTTIVGPDHHRPSRMRQPGASLSSTLSSVSMRPSIRRALCHSSPSVFSSSPDSRRAFRHCVM